MFLGVITGFIVMGVAFIVAQSSGVIDASQLMTSATSGPLLGVFILAMFFPSTNWKVSTWFSMYSNKYIKIYLINYELFIYYTNISYNICINDKFNTNIL